LNRPVVQQGSSTGLIQNAVLLVKSPLYSNALYLMLAHVLSAIIGFAFWIIVARIYPAGDVGNGSAIISAATLLIIFSNLGLHYGIVRFMGSTPEPRKLLNSCFTIAGSISLVSGCFFVLGLGIWAPALMFIRDTPVFLAIFLVMMPFLSIATLVDYSFVAGRRTGFALARNIIFNVTRMIIPFVLVYFFHAFGIFGSWGAAVAISACAAVLLFLPKVIPGYRPQITVSRSILKEPVRFSFLNYIADLLWAAPTLVLPVMVINMLGPEANAYYYLSWGIGSILSMIPSTVATSMFAEGSHDESKLYSNLLRSFVLIFALLIPAAAIVYFLADKVLLLYGSQYSQNASDLLRILSISPLPLAVNHLYFSMKRIKRDLKPLIILAALAAVITLVTACIWLPRMNISGAGLAWLCSQSFIALVIIVIMIRNRFIRSRQETSNPG